MSPKEYGRRDNSPTRQGLQPLISSEADTEDRTSSLSNTLTPEKEILGNVSRGKLRQAKRLELLNLSFNNKRL
jgi:hypothetical protein